MGRRDACDRTADGPVLQEGSSRCLARAHLRPDERGAPPARRSLRRRGARGAGVVQQGGRRASAHDISSSQPPSHATAAAPVGAPVARGGRRGGLARRPRVPLRAGGLPRMGIAPGSTQFAAGCHRRSQGADAAVGVGRTGRALRWPSVSSTHGALKTTVWIECGRELISTDAEPTTRLYCPAVAVGFMTTTNTVPSWFTEAVVSSILRLGDARSQRAPGRTNFVKWAGEW